MVFHKFTVFLWNLHKWWANSKITQMWFFCVISSSWLLFAWPPNLSWWNPDYIDGSYVTAIVSSGCLREDGAPPRIASFAYLAPRQARPSLRLRASPSSVVRADGLRLWWLKVAHPSSSCLLPVTELKCFSRRTPLRAELLQRYFPSKSLWLL